MNGIRWKYVALFVGVFIIGLLAMFPASLAVRLVPPVPGLVLGTADGTIWNGSVGSVEYGGLNLGRAEWTLNPLALLTLTASADVTLDRAEASPISASVAISPSGRTEVENLRGSLRLADLERARLMPKNIASGEVLLDLSRLVLEENRIVAADGRVGLTGLQSTLLPGVPLGSYEGKLETGNEAVVANFSDVEAPLRLNGRAELQPDGAYTASGSITPTDDTPEDLRRGLALLGRQDASGRYTFNFNGRL